MTDAAATTGMTPTIEQTVNIAASPATVWSFWTEPERLAEWWGSDAQVAAEPGGIYRVAMESGPVMVGNFVELDPPHRLVFTFGWDQNAPDEPMAPGSTRVEVTLTPDGDGTVLNLRHFDIPETHAGDHRKGWESILTQLVAASGA